MANGVHSQFYQNGCVENRHHLDTTKKIESYGGSDQIVLSPF